MKDRFGNPINVGDAVVFVRRTGNEIDLELSTVEAVGISSVRLKKFGRLTRSDRIMVLDTRKATPKALSEDPYQISLFDG